MRFPVRKIIAILAAAILISLPAQSQTVTVSPADLSLTVNQGEQVTASVVDDAGNRVGVAIRWVSANTNVAIVDDDGTVRGVGTGKTLIYAVPVVTSGLEIESGAIAVTVSEQPPSSITVHAASDKVAVGTWVPIYLHATDKDGLMIPNASARFASSDPDVARVVAGRLVGVGVGAATITATSGAIASTLNVDIVENPYADYMIDTYGAASTVRTGDVVRMQVLGIADERSVTLPASWSVDGNGASIEEESDDGVFVAEAPGDYLVTALIGPALTSSISITVEQRTHTQQLVKVGRGAIATHHSGDTWVFEGIDGRDYAYIGTFLHDWMKVWDITDPTLPILTDSLQFDARRINDVKIHPNSRIGIITREGASSRKNGIVMLDLSDPAHPEVISEYKETVTGGVHNVWIMGDEDIVYAVHNGTSDIHILDISDPADVKEVGRWGLDKENKSLHDVIVQDGYAYLSYWDDGLVILDAGNGSHGGTPTEPTFVSSYNYPAGNTHVAWRYGKYVFVGDEIFPPGWDPELPIEAKGYIHVLDVQDIDNPVEVARYEVPEAGAHNVWAEDDKLYVGYYQGGLRVLDIAGELRGDLYRQGREISVLKTTDSQTTVPNWPMTWGAQVFKGNIYTSDLNSGLWIAKLVDMPLVP